MPEIIIREIEEGDLEKGYLETLDFLRNTGDLDKNKANEILKKILNMGQNLDGSILIVDLLNQWT